MSGTRHLLGEAQRIEAQLMWMGGQLVGLADWVGALRRQLEEIERAVDTAEQAAYDRLAEDAERWR